MEKSCRKTPSRKSTQTVAEAACKNLPIKLPEQQKKTSRMDFLQILPLEVSLKILSELDIQSLCSASMTCRSWNQIIENCDYLWKHHCLSARTVCQREIDGDRGNGYSWKDTMQRNYWKSKVKYEWLTGKYSNIHSYSDLPEKSMYPMDVDTWGEILEAELERKEDQFHRRN